MKGRASTSLVPTAEIPCGGVPVAARLAMLRWASRIAVLCLVSSLPVSPATADDEDFFWEMVNGCKTRTGTLKYLLWVERGEYSGKYTEQARQCLDRWENEELALNRIRECTDIDAVKEFLREFPDSRHAGEASECIAELERRGRIERRLNECRAHFGAGRISTGVGGNAADCYEKLLLDYPGTQEAVDGIAEIIEHYSDRAERALDSGDPDAAEREIERLEKLVPESPDVEALRGKLDKLKRNIADQAKLEKKLQAVRAEAEKLLGQGRHEEVIALVSDASKRGLSDKRLDALGRRAEEALAEAARARNLAAKVDDVRARIAQGDFAGARESLQEAEDLGLANETRDTLAAEIDRAEHAQAEAEALRERDALVSESRALRERGDFAEAREALDHARELELPDARYREEMESIDGLEATHLLATCREHKSRRRWQEALTCMRRVIALDDDNAAAREEERQLDMLVAFSTVHRSPTVEGYFRFIQDYAWSPFVDAANEGLRELEEAYWEEVKAANTREKYQRYQQVYPAGRYTSEAARLEGGG